MERPKKELAATVPWHFLASKLSLEIIGQRSQKAPKSRPKKRQILALNRVSNRLLLRLLNSTVKDFENGKVLKFTNI